MDERHSDTPGSGVRLSINPLHERVADELRVRIITGRLAPGDKILVAELASEIGVSPTPLREALKVLATEGLVELMPNRGARVAPITVEQTRALFEVIAGMEALAAELAVRRATDTDIAELRDLHNRMGRHRQDAAPDAYFALNREIHDRIVAYARNDILTAHRGLLAQQAERVRFFALKDGTRRSDAFREHEELMQAFADRDADAARRIWRAHLLASGNQTCMLLALCEQAG